LLDNILDAHARWVWVNGSFLFISLDGARKDVLRWVTHGPYRRHRGRLHDLPWATLCEAVSCLRIAVNEGKGSRWRAARPGRDRDERRPS
jgi:hypothetical protein